MEAQEILTSSTDEKKQWETKEECPEGTIPIIRMKQTAPRKRRTLSTRFLNETMAAKVHGPTVYIQLYTIPYL